MMCNAVTRYGFVMLCMTSAVSMAADKDGIGNQGAGAAFFLSTDNEDFSTRRVAAEYLPKFRHGDSLTGVRYTNHYFDQNGWSRHGHQLSVLHRNVDPATATGWQIDAGVHQQGGHGLLTLDGAWRKQVAERTGLELFINRDWVETENALDRGIHFTFVGAALDQGFGQHVTLAGVVGRQEFSDDNYRNHGRVRLIVQPNLDLGLTLQARYRIYRSDREDVDGAYFNPDKYQEGMLAVGWRQRVQGWTGSVLGGVGQQEVADDPNMSTHLLEVALQSPATSDYSFRLRAGLNRSAAFQGPNYHYRYVQAEWIIGF